MPFIKTAIISTTYHSVKIDENGKTFGQQVDEAIAEVVLNSTRGSDGPSRLSEIALGFETDEEWMQFIREHGDMYSREFAGVRSERKARRVAE